MRTKIAPTPQISIHEAEANFRKVLKAVDRTGVVRLTENGKVRYHIEKEAEPAQVLARLKASMREHTEGKTRVLRSLADL